MPIPAYMTIQGASQGKITDGAFSEKSVGNIYQKGHENEIMVQEFEHEVSIPTDPQSGQPTGQRRHKELVVTKLIDKATPLLNQALVTGERLQCEITFYRTSVQGQSEPYYSIGLMDAVIVNIKPFMPDCLDPDKKQYQPMEKVAFSYRKITWTHKAAGTQGSDDWRTAGG